MDQATHGAIGEAIRAHRLTLRDGNGRTLSQSKFGRLVGVEGNTVNAWENGAGAPKHAQLCALVQKTGMDPRTLLGEPGEVDLAAVGLAA